MELLYDVVFKNAVTGPRLSRDEPDQLAKTPAMHVVNCAASTNIDGHIFLPVKTACGCQWEPAITLMAA